MIMKLVNLNRRVLCQSHIRDQLPQKIAEVFVSIIFSSILRKTLEDYKFFIYSEIFLHYFLSPFLGNVLDLN